MSGTTWRKSTFCNGATACVEVAPLPDGSVGVRDSKLGDDSPLLSFTPTEWVAFIAGVRAGEFDLSTLARAGDGSDGSGPARPQKAATAVEEASQVSR